ncbi:MCE family protein [Acetobacteraceae bacterium]|nr:MCE family protein [Acetobacteraceae bacterium]
MISKNNGQIVLSIGILLATIFFFVWCFKVNHSVSSVNFTAYRAVLTSVDGLKGGSPIFSKGVEIGKVESVNLNIDQDNAEITFDLKSQLMLPDDSSLTLVKSMTGESHLEIEPGRSTYFLRPGSVMKNTFSQPSLEQKISNYAFGGSVQN